MFDVTSKREMYAPPAGYSVRPISTRRIAELTFVQLFAGKDASRALGMSSLKPEDAVADYSTLDEKELAVLDDWVRFGLALAVSLVSSIITQVKYYKKVRFKSRRVASVV